MKDVKKFPTTSGQLYYGPWPGMKVLRFLKKEGVHTIWNLAAELGNLIPYEKSFVDNVLHGDVIDYDIPDKPEKFVKQLKHIVSLLNSGKSVFIHCFAGHGRTGMALASIDLLMNDAKFKEAITHAKAAAGGPETRYQVKFVDALAKYLKGDKEAFERLANEPPEPQIKGYVMPQKGNPVQEWLANKAKEDEIQKWLSANKSPTKEKNFAPAALLHEWKLMPSTGLWICNKCKVIYTAGNAFEACSKATAKETLFPPKKTVYDSWRDKKMTKDICIGCKGLGEQIVAGKVVKCKLCGGSGLQDVIKPNEPKPRGNFTPGPEWEPVPGEPGTYKIKKEDQPTKTTTPAWFQNRVDKLMGKKPKPAKTMSERINELGIEDKTKK